MNKIVKNPLVIIGTLYLIIVGLLCVCLNVVGNEIKKSCPKGIAYCLGQSTKEIQKDFKDGQKN